MKVAFHTLGCKVNGYETEAMKMQFSQAGYEIVSDEDVAQVYIINTCSVTGMADKKSRQYIRKAKKKNPDSLVVATGCYAQICSEEIKAMNEVDIVVGTNEKHNILTYVEEFQGEEILRIHPYNGLGDFMEMGSLPKMEEKTRATIKIQEGCNRFCSYCIIPFARGPVRSRKESAILNEAKELIDQGYKELVLTGINTALYDDLLTLLKKINDIDGDFRIRLSSLEPTVINSEFVKNLFSIEKLCHHLHLSLQSGSDKILKAMNRHYTMEEYQKIVDVLREYDTLYGLTSDIIVGFPGEGEKEFAESLAFVENYQFAKWHVFPYSKRKGTKAYNMKDQVEGSVKKERIARLNKKGEQSAQEFFKKHIGKKVKVLFEEKSGRNMVGYTDNYCRASLKTERDLVNKFLWVKVISFDQEGLIVEEIKK